MGYRGGKNPENRTPPKGGSSTRGAGMGYRRRVKSRRVGGKTQVLIGGMWVDYDPSEQSGIQPDTEFDTRNGNISDTHSVNVGDGVGSDFGGSDSSGGGGE